MQLRDHVILYKPLNLYNIFTKLCVILILKKWNKHNININVFIYLKIYIFDFKDMNLDKTWKSIHLCIIDGEKI